MANNQLDLVCDECYEALEWDVYVGMTSDRLYVKPCKHCAAQQSRAVDEGDSSAPEGDASPEVLPAGEAGSTPALHH